MVDETWRLGCIGAGVMAETMISGAVSGGFPANRVIGYDPNPGRLARLTALGGTAAASNLEVVRNADLAIVAVKPQSLPAVFAELRGQVPPDVLILSIVAGARRDSLRDGLEHARVARAMPNLPCRVHQGITIWMGASGPDAERVELVLSGMGLVRRVKSEGDVDRATAVSGTGPAIVAEFVRSMVDAANFVGLPRELAYDAVLATVIGTAEMIRRSDIHVGQLIDEVTSPGGTTSRALQELKNGRFSAVVTDAVDAAHRRTTELGEALAQSLADE